MIVSIGSDAHRELAPNDVDDRSLIGIEKKIEEKIPAIESKSRIQNVESIVEPKVESGIIQITSLLRIVT